MGKSASLFLRRLLQGMLVGSGAILPGVSGGVLCVTFGLYKPLMALLAHPFKNLPRYFKMLLPVGIGILLGFWGLSGLISHLFTAAEGLAASLFAGLILGTLPGLYREAGEQGRTAKSRNAMFVTFGLMLAFFLVLESSITVQLQANMAWMAFAGVLWGLSIVVPGMSSSPVLILLGLYQPMAQGIATLDPAVVAPLGAAAVATVLGLARVMDSLFEKHYAFASHAVLGIVAASALMILPRSFRLADLACAALGLALAIWLDRRQRAVPKAPLTESV